MTVLLTQRAETLKDHAGQISFPGGRIEPEDEDAWHAALRESYRGNRAVCAEFVEFAGYLPDHSCHHRLSGDARGRLCQSRTINCSIAAAEVHDVFEVPLDFILDAANHKSRRRKLGDLDIEVHDIPYGERNIWGATAGMLMTLRRMLQAGGAKRPMTERTALPT